MLLLQLKQGASRFLPHCTSVLRRRERFPSRDLRVCRRTMEPLLFGAGVSIRGRRKSIREEVCNGHVTACNGHMPTPPFRPTAPAKTVNSINRTEFAQAFAGSQRRLRSNQSLTSPWYLVANTTVCITRTVDLRNLQQTSGTPTIHAIVDKRSSRQPANEHTFRTPLPHRPWRINIITRFSVSKRQRDDVKKPKPNRTPK